VSYREAKRIDVEKSVRLAELYLFIFMTESTWRSYGSSKKKWKVSLESLRLSRYYKCDDGRFSVSRSCGTILNPISSREIGGRYSWNKKMKKGLIWMKSISGSRWSYIYFPKR
jgi:hypothetical protein